MALDEALLDAARERGARTFRVYSWVQPTVSLGRHQQVGGSYDPRRAAALGVPFVRRLTGGRALVHHREITYSVASPREPGHGPREDYQRINTLLVEVLGLLGVTGVSVAGASERMAGPGSASCFEQPAAGELVLSGAKLVGSAQVQLRGAWLQHGSILVDDDQPLLAQLATGAPPLPRPAATLRAALGSAPTPAVFAERVYDVLRATWDRGASVGTLDPADASAAEARRARYEDPVWTWEGST
jgi:lipoate-protein ligase A